MFTSVDKKEARSTTIQFLLIQSFLGVAFFFGVVTTSFAAAPVIFHSTESAGPGNVVQLQGANFGDSPVVLIQRVTASTRSLTPRQQLTGVSKSDTSVSAKIPATFPKGLYALWVSNGDLSQPVMVNRARVNQLEFPEVDAGRTFRLFGRNLILPGFTPSVRFVDKADGTKLSGTVVSVTGNDGYVYTVKASTELVVGHTYTIYFRNGAGGKWGEAAAADPLPVRSGGTDSFALGVPWGADFAPFASKMYDVKQAPFNAKGDGVTDDQAAIQSAIDTASAAGGGVVYFPDGTYNVVTFTRGVGLSMKSNVVLQGQSRTGTTLKFSPASDPGYPWSMIWWNDDITTTGLYELTVLNNTSFTSFQLYLANFFGANTSKLFVKKATIELNKWGSSLSFEGNRLLLDNVTVRNPSTQGNSLLLSQPGSLLRTSHYVIVRNSTFPNITRRLETGVDTIIENNTFTYNGDYQAEVESLQPHFWQGEQNSIEIRDRTVMLNNTFTHAGSTLFNSRNDGEAILNQMGSLNDANQIQEDIGAVTSADPTVNDPSLTLSDTSKDWSALNWKGFIVAITDGPGTGQWRTIVSSTRDTVKLDQAWQVVPTNESRYTLTRFGLQTALIKGNVLQNKERGIWIYTGGQDVAIVNNSLTDAAGIWVRSNNHASTKAFQVAWDVLVANNQVTRTAAQRNPLGTTGRPAHITASTYHQTPVTGSGILGVEMRDNVVTAVPGPELTYGPYPILRDSYTAAATYFGDGSFGSPDWTKASTRGVIFDGNSATNVENAYHLSSGAYQTVIANASASGVSQLVQDWGTYDGRLLNDTGWTAGDANLNQALLLDGVNDRVSLGLPLTPGGSPLPLGAAFTLEARIKTTGQGRHTILDLTGNGPSTNPLWGINAGKVWLLSRDTYSHTSSRSVNNGSWHHVAVSYDGAMIRFYVDGAPDVSFAASHVLHSGFGASLGGNVDGNWLFPGSLDEVRIWNITRSDAEILADANRELELTGSKKTGLTNYWRFNEGTGIWADDTAFEASVDSTVIP